LQGRERGGGHKTLFHRMQNVKPFRGGTPEEPGKEQKTIGCVWVKKKRGPSFSGGQGNIAALASCT